MKNLFNDINMATTKFTSEMITNPPLFDYRLQDKGFAGGYSYVNLLKVATPDNYKGQRHFPVTGCII